MCCLAMVWPTWSAANATVDPAPPAPTLVAPVNSSHTVKTKPLIIGLTKNDTWVKVYIDGTFNGQFKATNHASGTANFAYTPFLHLKPGWHQVHVNSMDSAGRASLPSATLRFFVEYPYPAPTVFTPVVDEATTTQRPWIVGIARNDSLVKVFIDSRLNGQMMVKNSSNGTGSFAYRTFYPITPGRHTFFAMAVDSTGKESRASDVMEFTVATPVTISPVPAVTDPQGVVKGDETKNQPSTIKSNDNVNSNGSVNANENANANTNSEVANTDTDTDNSRWPLIVGLTVLAVIIIVLIDNMVRRSRGRGSDDSNSKPFSSHEPKTPSQGNQPNQSNETNSNRPAKDFFPPPPPKLK
jgi:hypothetical protein